MMGSKRGFIASRRLIALVLSVVAIGLGACSMVKLGYENLPTLAVWEIGGALDLDATQKRLVERHVAEIRDWHRRRQLPEYVRFIGEIEGGLDKPVTVSQLTEWRERLLDAWTPLAERLAPAVAELALTLSSDQVKRLEREFETRNRKTIEEYRIDAPTAERERARRERFEKRAETFLGYLSDDQRRLIRDTAANASDERAWWALRVARQQLVIRLLSRISAERPSLDAAIAMTRETFSRIYWAVGGETRVAIERRARAADGLTAGVLQRSSPAQRRRLVETLRGYGADFATLASRTD